MREAIPLFPQYAFTAWCSVKHRDNFTFTSLMMYFLQWRQEEQANIWSPCVTFHVQMRSCKAMRTTVRNIFLCTLNMYHTE
jgi:hypothetical protein